MNILGLARRIGQSRRWSHWIVGGSMALAAMISFASCRVEPEQSVAHVQVAAEGLIHPLGLAALPDGSLFIAEEGTGEDDLSAGVSLMTAEGEIGRLISGLPSDRDAGDLSGVPLVAVSPGGDKLYIGNFGAGHLWTLPLTPGETVALPDLPYMPEQLGMAMEPLNNVMVTNPFDITFDANGVPVVSDASGNGVAKENPDGTTRFIHRFDPLPNTNNEQVTIDPVPTGITRVGREYYVTLLGGCPYPPESGQLVVIDEARHQRTLIDGLNMPIDVALGPDGTIWLLEFATFTPGASCFTGMGYQQKSGRLSRIGEDGKLETVVTELNYPGAVLPMPDGSLYVSEVFDGRLLHITFGPPDEIAETAFQIPQPEIGEPVYREITDVDGALAELIRQHNLQPYPGLEQREGDTALARLGQSLFFDPILSGDQNISCATCHHPVAAMADARVLPIGTGGMGIGPERDFVERVTLGPEAGARGSDEIEVGNPFIGQFVPRNSPTVLNSALLPVQFWDGRVESYALGDLVTTQEQAVNELGMADALAVQALFPVTSLHEMAGNTLGQLGSGAIRNSLLVRLEGIAPYRDQFKEIFGTDEIEAAQVAGAIAAFERQFIFTDAPWDRYVAGDEDALTGPQKRGALLFLGGLNEGVNCSLCHSGDLFTDLDYHNLLVPQLGPGKGAGENGREDWGRSMVSFDRRDQYSFRTPSLRNVTLTAPYFHSGAYATLEAVIWHHANIWESAANYDPSIHIPPAHYSSVRPFEPERQAHSAAVELRDGLPLSRQDVADLAAFLGGLTDPGATELSGFIPESVFSGLPLDPLPDAAPLGQAAGQGEAAAVARSPDEPDAGAPSWRFNNVTDEVGLSFRHGAFFTDLYEDPAAMMGGGLCWIDYDKDGWLDLYLVNSHAEAEISYWEGEGRLPQNGLFRNENGLFSNVSSETNVDLSMRGNGCVAADFNKDGWMDLHVTADGPNALLWNNGDGTFREGAVKAGIATPEWNSTANVADLNLDGWPDLFVGSFIDLDYPVPRPTGAFPGDYYGLPDHLYLNNGPDAGGWATFTEVTKIAGLARDERALGAIFSDLDDDGDLDLYIANDGQANRLYEYQPWPGGAASDPEGLGFRFVEQTQQADVGDTGSGMGVAGGDYDGDGLFDLFVTNWEAELNAIYRNETAEEGFLNFRYSTFRIGMRGLGNNMTGWGTTWADFDHDTDADLLTVNGRVPVTNWETDPELVRLYGNRLAEGFPGEYREWTALVGLEEIGPFLARGSAAADFDNDGDLDVALNQIGGMAVILRNDGGQDSGNWLEVGLNGFYPGAVVTVKLPDGRLLRREAHAGSSYLASEDPRLHFGLGDVERVAELVVVWPDGHQSRLLDVESNQLISLSP